MKIFSNYIEKKKIVRFFFGINLELKGIANNFRE